MTIFIIKILNVDDSKLNCIYSGLQAFLEFHVALFLGKLVLDWTNQEYVFETGDLDQIFSFWKRYNMQQRYCIIYVLSVSVQPKQRLKVLNMSKELDLVQYHFNRQLRQKSSFLFFCTNSNDAYTYIYVPTQSK